MKKSLIIVLLTLLLVNTTFGYDFTVRHTELDTKVKGYFCSGVGSSTNDCSSSSGNQLSVIPVVNSYDTTFSYSNNLNIWKKFIIVRNDRRLLVGISTKEPTTVSDTNWVDSLFDNNNIESTSYFTPSVGSVFGGWYASNPSYFTGERDLVGNVCGVQSISTPTIINDNYDFVIDSTLNPITKISGALYHVPIELQNDYYYMKSFAVMEISNGVNTYYLKPTNAISKYTYNSNTFNQSGGTTLSQVQSIIPNFNRFTNPIDLSQQMISEHLPYILLKPNAINVNFNLNNFKTQKQSECDNGVLSSCGNYNVKVIVIPIDGKCDFNQNGTIDLGSEFLSAIDTSSFVIDKDSDGDGIFDMQEISGTYTNLNEIRTQ